MMTIRHVIAHPPANLPGGGHAVHAGHLPVHEHDKEPVAVLATPHDPLHSLAAREHPLASHTELVEQDAGGLAGDPVVVDHQGGQVDEVARSAHVLGLAELERQGDGERGPLAHRALDGDVAVHHPHDVTGDRETQAGTLVAGHRRPLPAREGLEEVGQVLLAHADAAVAHRELKEAAPGVRRGLLGQRDLDRCPPRACI